MQLYRLSSEQRMVFAQQLQETGLRILGVSFSNPEDDQRNIRHQAYLTGKFELLKDILQDDFPETNHTES